MVCFLFWGCNMARFKLSYVTLNPPATRNPTLPAPHVGLSSAMVKSSHSQTPYLASRSAIRDPHPTADTSVWMGQWYLLIHVWKTWWNILLSWRVPALRGGDMLGGDAAVPDGSRPGRIPSVRAGLLHELVQGQWYDDAGLPDGLFWYWAWPELLPLSQQANDGYYLQAKHPQQLATTSKDPSFLWKQSLLWPFL